MAFTSRLSDTWAEASALRASGIPPPNVETEAVTWVTLLRLTDVLISDLILLTFNRVFKEHFYQTVSHQTFLKEFGDGACDNFN